MSNTEDKKNFSPSLSASSSLSSTSKDGNEETLIITLFNSLKTYPYEKHDKIHTHEFLITCNGVVTCIEKLGKAFTPIKYDIQGNINKLQMKFNEDPLTYGYVQDMILAEKAQGNTAATDALQWLRRGLHFFVKFFSCLIDDYKDEVVDENLSKQLKEAYSQSLERYHSWLGKQLFSILCKFVPKRRDLYKVLAMDKEIEEHLLLNDMEVYVIHLDKFVETLTDFYNLHQLETFYRV